ncbi:NAD+ synthase [uncultured Alistipes sp.]|uniref:NAD+ synthase n=1 Tax=uncultured Alistipes sp. TaxID=538949 RepID=UPI001F894E85|nr:NAD+ synthase [uncultured Alistipes sp.]HJC17774.1 NAD+ synthase [Candidatus Alistipes stercorigallinarum]
MKIAIAQLNYTIGDVEGNTSKIIDSIQKAKERKADLVIFAEQAVSGTPAFDLLRKTTFLELCEDALVEIASCCDGIAAIVGLPILTSEGTISAAALIQDRKVLRYVGKKYITARREMGFLVGSKGYEYATIKGHKCAIVVGDDLSRERDYDKSVETVISINARKYGKGTMTYRYEVMRNLSFVEGKNIVMVNQVGGSTDIVYDGTSGAFNNRGELVLMMKNFEEDFQIFDTRAQARPVVIPTSGDRTRLVYEAARCGLRDFFLKNGYRKASIGLSGGIDSAVVACLAADALGRENVRALLMPSQFSSDHSVEDAKALAENLGIEYNVIPITEIYKSVVDTLKPVIGGREFDSTEENIQTRIRTILLMAVQNKTDYVLLNSSNKSENALGLCTLYGDTAGAFSPTGDLYKSEMYDVARYINRTFGNPIPENILDKEPSSELHPNQKDSDILPPYEVVDAILYRMIEEGQHREEIVNAGFDSEVVEKIHSMIMRNEKKRYQFPPVLRLSMCSFGHERLMPLTNKYGD